MKVGVVGVKVGVVGVVKADVVVSAVDEDTTDEDANEDGDEDGDDEGDDEDAADVVNCGFVCCLVLR